MRQLIELIVNKINRYVSFLFANHGCFVCQYYGPFKIEESKFNLHRARCCFGRYSRLLLSVNITDHSKSKKVNSACIGLGVVLVMNQCVFIFIRTYILLHLLHKSARKLLEVSEINGLSEIILRLLEKMRYVSNFYFICQYFVDKLLKDIACASCKIIISF